MYPNMRHLLIVILAAGSASIATPSYAQFNEKSPETASNNASATATEVKSAEVSSSKSNPNPEKGITVSESTTNSPVAEVKPTTANTRVPIFSRIFPAPSMKQ